MLIRKTENYDAGQPVSSFWRWDCQECKAIWFDPMRVVGGYWSRQIQEELKEKMSSSSDRDK